MKHRVVSLLLLLLALLVRSHAQASSSSSGDDAVIIGDILGGANLASDGESTYLAASSASTEEASSGSSTGAPTRVPASTSTASSSTGGSGSLWSSTGSSFEASSEISSSASTGPRQGASGSSTGASSESSSGSSTGSSTGASSESSFSLSSSFSSASGGSSSASSSSDSTATGGQQACPGWNMLPPPGRLPSAYIGQPFDSVTFSAIASGTSGFLYTVTALPTGLSLSSSGVITGAAQDLGSFAFAVTATAATCVITQHYLLDVVCGQPAIIPSLFQLSAVAWSAFSQDFFVAAAVPGWNFSAPLALPFGLQLSPSGVLFGTPIIVGSAYFQIQLSYDMCTTVAYSYTLDVVSGGPSCPGGSLHAASSNLPDAVLGQPYIGPLLTALAPGITDFMYTLLRAPLGLSLEVSEGAATVRGTYMSFRICISLLSSGVRARCVIKLIVSVSKIT
jgi:hypothetical protein